MNKTELLQILELLKETRDYLGVEETPRYESINFLPIASDRFVHTEAAIALAHDIGEGNTDPPSPETTVVATEASVN